LSPICISTQSFTSHCHLMKERFLKSSEHLNAQR
jgi:hypothetical protein